MPLIAWARRLRWLLALAASFALTRYHEPPPPGAEGTWPVLVVALIFAMLALAYVSRVLQRRLSRWSRAATLALLAAAATSALLADGEHRRLARECIVAYPHGGSVEILYFPAEPAGRLAELIERQSGSRQQALDAYGDDLKRQLDDPEQLVPRADTTVTFIGMEVVFSISLMLGLALSLGRLPAGAELATSPKPARAAALADFVIITALEEERDAVLRKLPGSRKLDRDGSGAHTYYEARLATRREDGAVYRVLVTSLSGMGPTKGTSKAGAVVRRWNPAHVLLVGIGGGVEGEVGLGDVVVASQIVDYTVGKIRSGAPRVENWRAYPADADLLDAAGNFAAGWEDLVAGARPAEGAPRRHVGVVASGGDVIASREQIAAFREDWPKLLGVEMEGGGVAAGLHDEIERPRFLMIRGVSDLADGADNAETKARWRAYACDVAAAYAVGFLRDGPVKAST